MQPAIITAIILIPMICGITAYISEKKQKDPFPMSVYASGIVLLLVSMLMTLSFTKGPLEPVTLFWPITVQTDGFRLFYAFIAAFMWTVSSAFGLEYFAKEKEHGGRYVCFLLITLGATEGLMLSADFMTAFLFFEILSFTSFTWVIQEETKEAIRAAYTYLFIAVFGGLLVFMGMALVWHHAGTLLFMELPGAFPQEKVPYMLAAGLCILLGFGAKAGMFPLHVWLPMAHPVAPSPASALLSGILTKVGIFGILMVATTVMSENTAFGFAALILGLITMVIGAVLAVLSSNLKRTLACSSMSQIGFILTGIAMMVLFGANGLEEEIVVAKQGALLHMVGHSLIKLVLFCAAGVVVMHLHTINLDDIRGFGRNKKGLKILFAIGAFCISGVPGFSGFISKTLLHEALIGGIGHLPGSTAFWKTCEWIFLCSGGMTFAYMLKLFFCVFVEKNADEKRQALYDEDTKGMNKLSLTVLSIPAAILLLLGQPPVAGKIASFMMGEEAGLTYGKAFGGEALLGGLCSLVIGGALYFFVIRKLAAKNGGYGKKSAAANDRNRKQASREVSVGETLLWIAKGSVSCIAGMIRLINYGMDAPVKLFVRFLKKEQKKDERHTPIYGIIGRALTGNRDEFYPIAGGFSFALMMTCAGILIIMFVLIFTIM